MGYSTQKSKPKKYCIISAVFNGKRTFSSWEKFVKQEDILIENVDSLLIIISARLFVD